MSNLSNQYISSSFQSLLNLQGQGSGLTVNLQTVQDGVGVSSPISLSTTQVLISGSLIMSGSIIPATSGSYDIGSTTKPFRHIYASSGSIYLDNNQILTLGDGGSGVSLYAPPSGSITFENDIVLNNNSAEFGSTFTLIGTGPNDQSNMNFNASTAFVQNISGSLNLSVNTVGGNTSGSLTLVAQNGGSIQLEANGNNGTGSVNLIAHSGSINLQTYSNGNIAIQTQESGSVGINSAISVEVTTPQFVFEGSNFEVLNGGINVLGTNPQIDLKSNMEGSGSVGGGIYSTVDTLSGTTTNLFFGYNINNDLNNGSFGPALSSYNSDAGLPEACFYGPGYGNNYNNTYSSYDDIIFKLDATVSGGTPNPVLWYRDTDWTGYLNITGSLGVTNIKGTGSLFLQPDQSDARYLEVYNTSPTDTHITASGGQIYIGNDVTYVKVDNYGTVKHIDIVAENGIYVSGSLDISGSLISVTSDYLTIQTNPSSPQVITSVSSSAFPDGIFNSHTATYDGQVLGFAWSTYNSIPENSLSANFYGPGVGNHESPYGGNDDVVFQFKTGSSVLDWYRDTNFSGSLNISSSLTLRGGLNIASGSNKTMGTVALNGGNPGTVTVSNNLVTTSSLIFLTKQTYNHSAGIVGISSKGSGTFTISSGHNGDTDVVAYQIINPA